MIRLGDQGRCEQDRIDRMRARAGRTGGGAARRWPVCLSVRPLQIDCKL